MLSFYFTNIFSLGSVTGRNKSQNTLGEKKTVFKGCKVCFFLLRVN